MSPAAVWKARASPPPPAAAAAPSRFPLGSPPQGCREKTDPFKPSPKEWSAFRSRDYGYTRMQAVNATHLYLEQVSDDQVRHAKLAGAGLIRP